MINPTWKDAYYAIRDLFRRDSWGGACRACLARFGVRCYIRTYANDCY